MTREIVLDTETTGISPAEGHRVVEIGAVELINHLPSGQTFHAYINPERDMPKEAEAVHGLSSAFLKDKPLFKDVARQFQDFIAGDMLVIHNASFDVGFLNAELSYLDQPLIEFGRVTDTLALARRRHPMASNSLDALCRRYGIDNSRRTKHGALLDAELLAEVYLELIGGRQVGLELFNETKKPKTTVVMSRGAAMAARSRPEALPPRLTEDERQAHAALIKGLGPAALWKLDEEGTASE
ncbi:MAG: DNA polymerase III subunit epsilon [Hyphomicrobiales bacterium]